MEILTETTGFMGSHEYFLIENGKAVIIDPADADLAIEILSTRRLTLSMLILTHEHCDHNYGCNTLREEYHCPVYASGKCSENLGNARKNYSQYYSALVNLQGRLSYDEQKEVHPFTSYADKEFHDELNLEWEGHRLFLKETPGHSEGSICILVDNQFLFIGDSLMWMETVNTRFIGGSLKDYKAVTLPWLNSLSRDIYVYPGHLQGFKLGDRLKEKIF